MNIIMAENAVTEHRKKVDDRCLKCFRRTYERLFLKYNIGKADSDYFLQYFDETWRKNCYQSAPEIQLMLTDEFKRLTSDADHYAEEKKENNEVAIRLCEELKTTVSDSPDPFIMALRLAIAGNIMDYGAQSSFDIHATIDRVLHSDFAIDHSEQLREKFKTAKMVLYLGDNAGEIMFDKLFIEISGHRNVIFAVRGKPVLNDATLADAEVAGMHEVAGVISNGAGNPSTILNSCSTEFRECFRMADLIISKGQGNLEGLVGLSDPRIFFLLMAKCDVNAERLGVEKGSFVIVNGRNLS